jgi:hypothetical protein
MASSPTKLTCQDTTPGLVISVRDLVHVDLKILTTTM